MASLTFTAESVVTHVCSKCGAAYPWNEEFFYRDSSLKRGFKSRCKECMREDQGLYRKLRFDNDEDGSYIENKRRICRESYARHKERRNAARRGGKFSDYNKNSFIKSTYGITLEDFDAMMETQNGVCAICGQEETRKNKHTRVCRLSIDHDHETGVVRGLLCSNCNFALGGFRDDIELLESAIQYLAGKK